MMTSKKYITNFILSLIGFFIIIIILWVRILRYILNIQPIIMLPLALKNMIVIFFIIIYSYFLYTTILFLLKKEAQIFNKNVFFIRLINIIFLIKKSPQIFYTTIIFPNLPVAFFLEKPLFNILKFFVHKKKKIIYIFFKTFPRTLVSTIFLINIFYFDNKSYFVISLFFLLLPLFYNSYYYMADHLCDKNVPYFRDHLIFKKSKIKGYSDIEFADVIPNYNDAKDIITHRNNDKLLQWFIYNYDVYTNIKNFLLHLQRIEDKYKPYENLYVYSCYLIGWLYILYINLILYF
jgi:hypothetical protein